MQVIFSHRKWSSSILLLTVLLRFMNDRFIQQFQNQYSVFVCFVFLFHTQGGLLNLSFFLTWNILFLTECIELKIHM